MCSSHYWNDLLRVLIVCSSCLFFRYCHVIKMSDSYKCCEVTVQLRDAPFKANLFPAINLSILTPSVLAICWHFIGLLLLIEVLFIGKNYEI